MRTFGIILAVLFTIFQSLSQDFKSVKTAQDVIDNYIASSGGEEAISEVKSMYMKGKFEGEGHTGSLEIFFGKSYFYMDINMSVFQMKQAVDFKKKSGWVMFGNSVKDMNEEEMNRSMKSSEGSLWGYYLEPAKYGITYQMMQNEEVSGTDTYVIEFIQNSATLLTAYFDIKSFNKIKQIKGNDVSEFTDFRKVGSTDVIMPYSIKNKNGDVAVEEIKLNSKFDKKLLKKPVIEN
jgi:hypothetical protein